MCLFPQAVFRERVQFSEHQTKEERRKLDFVLGSGSANSVFMLEAMMPPFTFNSASLWELRLPSLLSYDQTWWQWEDGPILCRGTALPRYSLCNSFRCTHCRKRSKLDCASLLVLESGNRLRRLFYSQTVLCHLPCGLPAAVDLTLGILVLIFLKGGSFCLLPK